MSASFDFSSQYLTGIRQVDREHRKLFEICSDVQQALLGDAASAEKAVREAVCALGEYTRTHFASEEALMSSLAYPELESHRSLHADLLRQLSDLEMRVEIGEASPIDLSRFVASWLANHIENADKRFGAFAREGNTKP